MGKKFSLGCGILAIVVWNVAAQPDKGGISPVLLVEPIGRGPLPFQPIRLRITLSNQGDAPTQQLHYLETRCRITGIKGPTNLQFQPVGTRGHLDLRPFETIGTTSPYDHAASEKRHQLAAGRQQSVCGPFVGGGYLEAVRPLFTEPGEHTLRVEFLQNATEGPHLQAEPLMVAVGKPTGEDAAWFEFLQKKKNVRDAFVTGLAYRVGPQPREGGALEALIVLYPKSSYAAYARFALAARIVYDHENNRRGKLPLQEAWDHLAAIDFKDFAYAPDALVLMKKIKEYQHDEDAAAKIGARLQKEYPDAIEWFEEQVRSKVPFEKIQENRKAAQPRPDLKKP